MRALVLGAEPLHLLERHDARVAVAPQPAHVRDDDVPHERQRPADLQDLVHLLLVLADDDGRLGVRDDVLHLRRRARRVDADPDGGRAHRGELRPDPLAAVLREDRDLVAALHPERDEAEAEAPDVAEVVLPGDALPDAELLLAQRDRARRLGGAQAEELRERVRHESHRFLRL